MIIVSSCLLGLCTKYDGTSNSCSLIMDYSKHGKYLPLCPEQLGGLTTPRSPLEISKGSGEDVLENKAKVLDSNGQDYSSNFIKGAEEVLKAVKIFPITAAILKERSPSCGSSYIYDGSFSGKLTAGQGVTTALLTKHNVPVYSEEEITTELLERLLKDLQ